MTDIQFQLPEQALVFIDSKADEMLLLLSPEPQTAPRPKPAVSLSHQPVDHVLTEKDISQVTLVGTVDGFGNNLSRYFPTGKGNIGLTQESYPLSEKLATKIALRKELRNYISAEFVIDVLFEWFKAKYTGVFNKSDHFSTYLTEQIHKNVAELHVAVPISFLTIDRPFSLGKVKFDFYDSSFFDRFELAISADHPSEPDRKLDKERKEYQGIVFAHLDIQAERTRAHSLAVELTDQALAILRLFSPSVYFPQVRSYFGRKGHAIVPVNHFFVFESEWPVIETKVAIDGNFMFDIKEEFLKIISTGGLEQFDQLLNQTVFTDLEEVLLDSITLFSKGISSPDLHDRLIFLFASIESLLLKDSGEPIQKTIGQRLGFLLFPDGARRLSVSTFIGKAYGHRSMYVHHGERQEILNIASNLSILVSSAILKILRKRDKFKIKTDLINAIELAIYS
jgi:hypothetical protein